MSKINTNYWGANVDPASYGGYTYSYGCSTNSIKDLIAAGKYDPNTDSFDLSVSPWGIGYSAAGNRGQIVLLRNGSRDGAAPGVFTKIMFDGMDKENSNRPFALIDRNHYFRDSFRWLQSRVGGDITVDSNNYMKNAAVTYGSEYLSQNSTKDGCLSLARVATYLDYQKYKLRITGFSYINLDTGQVSGYEFRNTTETVEQAKTRFNNFSFPEHMAIINIRVGLMTYAGADGSPTSWSDYPYMGYMGNAIQLRGHSIGSCINFNQITATADDDTKFKLCFTWNLGIYNNSYASDDYATIPQRYWSTDTAAQCFPVEGMNYRTGGQPTFNRIQVNGLGFSTDDQYRNTNMAGNFCDKEQSFSDITYKQRPLLYRVVNSKLTEVKEGDAVVYDTYNYYKLTSIYEVTDSDTFTKAQILALIKHEVAFYGFEFYIGWGNADGGTFEVGSDDLFLPKFDEHLITTGMYTSGTASLSEPNATWGNVFGDDMPDYDSEYNPSPQPGPGPGPGPDPNPNPLYPSIPGFSLASAGGKCYALVDGAIDTIFEEIYGRDEDSWLDLINGLSLYGADPMAAIISYKWYPWAWSFTGTAGLYLGGIRIGNSAYDVPRTDAEALHTENASFYYGREKNFINSRHSQARLWLPFYGFYALPQQKFISEKLTVDFHYNLPDEVGVWIISFDDVIYDFVECQCSIDVPLSATDYRGQKYAAISGVLSAAGNLINSVGEIAKSAVAIGVGAATGLGAASAYEFDTGQSILSAIKKEGIAAFQGFDGDQKMQIGMMGSGATQAAGGAINLGTSLLGIAKQGFNDVISTRRTLNQMKINLPYHGAASPTTFLNLPMFPFIQVYTNNTIDDYVGKDSQYKLKNGHACDKWVTASEMPSNSLCQASGIADMNTSGMELSEVEELNSILQNGFFIAIE